MYEKSLIVIIFMYSLSFGVLAAQYIWADPLGITLTDKDGNPLRPSVLTYTNTTAINQITSNIVNSRSQENSTLGPVDNAFGVGYYVGWQLIQLLSGTYIFTILYLLGVPALALTPFVIIYVILLGRTLIAYIRGL